MPDKMPALSKQDAAAVAVSRDRLALAALERQGLPITAESFCEAYAVVLDAEERR